jgi:hypothetical protein
MSVGMGLINNCSYVPDVFPNWAKDNENRLESEGLSHSAAKRRIDFIVWRNEYRTLIENFTTIQNQKYV